MARFEVLGRDADRDLIRSLARRLAEDGPDASRLRAAVSQTIAGEPPKKGGILAALRLSPLVGSDRDAGPVGSLLAWMSEQNDENLFIASQTVAEIRRGVLEKPAGKPRDQLEVWFSGSEGPQALFAGRVLPFDENAGLIWARLMAGGKAQGRPRSALDTIIAAVAEAHGCTVVTDNEKDFPDIQVINPLRGAVR